LISFSGQAPGSAEALAATTRSVSSAEYIANQVKAHKRGAIAIVAMVLMAIATAIVVYAWRMKHTAVAAAMRVVPFTSYPGNEVGAAFSPDGNQIAFIWDGISLHTTLWW